MVVDDERIRLAEVTYAYPRQAAPSLIDISLQVKAGEVLAVMGPTGAGKTTLVSLLNGLIPQHFEGQIQGHVTVCGLSTYGTRIQVLIEHVGLVLQDPETQIFGITVQEDTAFGPSNLAYPREAILARVKSALARVGLTGYEDRLTAFLSGGEKQRLAIAGVLAMQPEILVLDEPTSELDPAGRAEVLDTVEGLRRHQAVTVIYVEHEAEDVLRLADRVAVMVDGRLAWQGRPQQLFRDVPLTRSFAIRPPQMAEVGYRLAQLELISAADIPLTVAEAEPVVRRVLNGRRMVPAPALAAARVDRPALIEISGLTHVYEGGIQALVGVDLTIGAG